MKVKKILISGASIAGPTLAFWLHRYGFEVTIVERAESLRLGGQNVDIKGAAQKIAQWMGIEEEIRAADTGELGVLFVDKNNVTKAALPKGESNLGTSELEILRGDLVKILYEHTKENVEYLFGNQIIALDEHQDGVKVTFQNGEIRDFDLVICADGIRSRTRSLIFGDEPVVKPVGLYVSYFTIPRTATDSRWARWYNATDARVIFMRPDNECTTRASFSFMSEPKGYEKLSQEEQKALLQEKFADAGWEAKRVLAELDNNADVYFDTISQVFAPRWSEGRCAMTGDAAFCPSPLTGMGVSLSVVGAYILAGELSRHDDHSDAFAAYDKAFRPYVTEIQKLPPGVPRLAHPKTKLGIFFLNTILNLISSKFVKKIGQLFSDKNKSSTDDTIELEEYGK
ncbi:FAD-dependent monooxygenase [Aquirufa antheringensis]|uniref:FAD-dependent monooxygenase n=1 Tax=Aquirufa antheringensis TaxID=2516559 RepID=UPI0022A8B27D|nr:FAD-dependent monooxygenase [Aquirufa antheringensis]MCZ2487107.1 FAD-binding monooxygenase [Aquirufa antheringensis]MCZ2489911.1 FAD-binding monooxygenase [Aquirufa antheringensis]